MEPEQQTVEQLELAKKIAEQNRINTKKIDEVIAEIKARRNVQRVAEGLEPLK